MMDVASGEPMPDELDPRHLRRRLLELAALVVVVVALLLFGPGLGSLRSRLRDASAGWLAAAAGLELLSAPSYAVVFRTVFCRRMSYQIGMSSRPPTPCFRRAAPGDSRWQRGRCIVAG